MSPAAWPRLAATTGGSTRLSCENVCAGSAMRAGFSNSSHGDQAPADHDHLGVEQRDQ